MTHRLLIVAIVALAVTTSAQQVLAQAKLVETVIRICARNAASAVSCWALQSGGGWAIDQGLTAAWNRISGPGSNGAKAAPAKPPAAAVPHAAQKPAVGSQVLLDNPRFQPLDQHRLSELLKGVNPPPGWTPDARTQGVILYAPARPGSQSTALVRGIESALGQKAAPPPPGAASPPTAAPVLRPGAGLTAGLGVKNARQHACEHDRALKSNLSLSLFAVAPAEQRSELMKRWNAEIVAPCATLGR